MLLTIEIEIAWYKQFPSPTTLCAIYELRTVLGNLAATPQIFGRIYLHVVLIVDNILLFDLEHTMYTWDISFVANQSFVQLFFSQLSGIQKKPTLTVWLVLRSGKSMYIHK